MAICIGSIPAHYEGDTGLWVERTSVTIESLDAISNALADDEYVGGIMRFPVADGYATYRVVSVSPPRIEHIRLGDAYSIHGATMRGLNGKAIMAQVDHHRAMHRLFGRRAG